MYRPSQCDATLSPRAASAAFHKYGDAPRASRRPPRKARGGRIPGVFDRRATQRGGMHRRPNATVFMKVSTQRSPRSTVRSASSGTDRKEPFAVLDRLSVLDVDVHHLPVVLRIDLVHQLH